jgi:hypothetical protein
MRDAHSLTQQVRRNCTISDARFAGLYSVCELVMRLRDLYKWEHSLAPHEEHEASPILDWIGRKEALWEDLQESEFIDLVIDGQRIDPFDTEKINRLIEPQGFFYGAGYAQRLKPSFLLATIEKKSYIQGHPVVFLTSELARDLLTLPALTQDNTIVLRQSAVELYVWDQMLYLSQSGQPYFRFGLSACGIFEKDFGLLRHCLPKVIKVQQDTFLYHEIGELTDTFFDRRLWRDMIAALPQTRTELLVRAVKDILADTCPEGTLHQIVRLRQTAALGFYAAFLDGLRKKLFPEIRIGLACFMRDGDWAAVAIMIRAVHEKAKAMALSITTLFVTGTQHHNPAWVDEELGRRYIDPLTS